MNGSTDYTRRDTGLTPPGSYTVDPSQISAAGFFRKYLDPRDWGDYRAPLDPDPDTNTFVRSGFFLHGGNKRHGFEGCIKVEGDNQNDLFDKLKQNEERVRVYVVPMMP